MAFWTKISGVMGTLFQIGGPSGPKLKSNSGAVEVRNSSDGAFAVARGNDPSGNDDLVTKRYADALIQDGFFEAAFAHGDFAGGSVVIGTMPASLSIPRVVVVVDVVFDGAATASVGDVGNNSRLMTTAQNTLTVAAVYDTHPVYEYGAATELRIYLGGTPTVGSGRVFVYEDCTDLATVLLNGNSAGSQKITTLTAASANGDAISYGQSGTKLGNLVVGATTIAADAIMEVQSTTLGARPVPTMTTAQRVAIVAPTEPLYVYDSDLHTLCVYKLGAWYTSAPSGMTLELSDKTGVYKTVTAKATAAGGTVSSYIHTSIRNGTCLRLRVKANGNTTNSKIEFFSDSGLAAADLVFEADGRNCYTSPYYVMTLAWAIPGFGTALTDDKLYYRITNSGVNDSTYDIEMVLMGVAYP